MAIYSTFAYGTGVLYGVSMTVTSVDPERGPSTGGNTFAIEGTGFNPTQWDSEFTGVTLDPAIFTDISSGTGSATTALPNLVLSSGAVAGGVGAIQTLALQTDTQFEVETVIDMPLAYPASEVALLEFVLYIDATNYATFGIYLGTSLSTLVLRATTVLSGSTMSTYETAWTTGSSKLKILRWGSELYFIANGSVVHREVKFQAGPCLMQLSTSNNAATYTTSTKVKYFYYRPYVVFGNRPVHAVTVVSDSRIRGVVPASWDERETDAAFAGLTDIYVVGVSTYPLLNSYEYYYVNQLVVMNSGQSGIRMNILSDNVLKTPSTSLRGLGEKV
jgi:hypothetical protein